MRRDIITYERVEKKTVMPQEFYQITIKGHLNPNWADWFDGLTIIALPNGTTVISGSMADQAMLHGVLNRIRDLGLTLLSVQRAEPEADDGSKEK